jgi:hypothetical protein
MLTAAALALALTQTAATTEHAYVVADVLRVRAAPDATAAEVDRLPINHWVNVHERRDEWARIELPSGDPGGWVSAELLAPKRLRQNEALGRARAAKTDEERLTWARRAVAQDGTNEEAWRLLAAVAEATQPHIAERARATVAGTRAYWVAVCEADSTLAIAGLVRADQDHRFEPLPVVHPQETEATAAQLRPLQRIANQLRATSWFRPSWGGAPVQVNRGPYSISKPSIRAVGSSVDKTLTIAIGECKGMEGQPWSVVLTTAPLKRAPVGPATIEEVMKLSYLGVNKATRHHGDDEVAGLTKIDVQKLVAPAQFVETLSTWSTLGTTSKARTLTADGEPLTRVGARGDEVEFLEWHNPTQWLVPAFADPGFALGVSTWDSRYIPRGEDGCGADWGTRVDVIDADLRWRQARARMGSTGC